MFSADVPFNSSTSSAKMQKPAPKVTHGILKNGHVSSKTDAPKSNYINRNTVQRVLEQQRKVRYHYY